MKLYLAMSILKMRAFSSAYMLICSVFIDNVLRILHRIAFIIFAGEVVHHCVIAFLELNFFVALHLEPATDISVQLKALDTQVFNIR